MEGIFCNQELFRSVPVPVFLGFLVFHPLVQEAEDFVHVFFRGAILDMVAGAFHGDKFHVF